MHGWASHSLFVTSSFKWQCQQYSRLSGTIYLCIEPFVKWKILVPANTNLMFWWCNGFGGIGVGQVNIMIHVSHLYLVVMGWGTILSLMEVRVRWRGWVSIPTIRIEVWFSWGILDAVNFATVVTQEMDWGQVVGWCGWSARQWRHRPFVLFDVLLRRVVPVS